MKTISAYTPQQEKLLALFSDGDPHSRDEIRAALDDPLMSDDAIKVLIQRLRARVPSGEDIVCVSFGRNTRYQHVRLLLSHRSIKST